jgi:hypothetical protein
MDDRHVIRKGAETLRVFINPDTRHGDLETEIPSIGVTDSHGTFYLFLTWSEAKALATAIDEVTGVAEHG